jgi:hypothetical protein
MATKTDRSLNMRKLHAMLNETGLIVHKKAFLEGYGVTSASNLTDEDLEHLTNRISQIKNVEIEKQKRKARSAILSVLQKLAIYNTNDDWGAVNEYLMQPQIAGKLLYEMSNKELDSLIIKLNSILTKYLAKQAEIKRLADNN